MLLRFTSPDILNTSLFDVATGQRAYEIITEALPEPSEASSSKSTLFSPTASIDPLPSFAGSSTAASVERPEPTWSHSDYPEGRHTRIVDACGNAVVNVVWKNGRPSGITIDDEIVGGLNDLFGSSAVPFMPKMLAIPTRFDSESVWHATEDSLSLYDYSTKSARGTFHQNCIRIPTPLKSKQSLSAPKSLKSKPSKLDLSFASSPNSLDEPQSPTSSHRSAFIPAARLPGLGSDYLEFDSHPLAHDAEIILSFLMMEILRRGRFLQLTPYTWDSEPQATKWDFKEVTKGFFSRRGARRNTV